MRYKNKNALSAHLIRIEMFGVAVVIVDEPHVSVVIVDFLREELEHLRFKIGCVRSHNTPNPLPT